MRRSRSSGGQGAGRMPEVVEPHAGQPSRLGRRQPHPLAEVAAFERRGLFGREDVVLGAGVAGVAGPVTLQLGDQHGRQGDSPAAGAVLGVVLDHLAGGQTKALPADDDGDGDQVDVAPAQGEQLTLAQAAEAGAEDEGAVAVRHGAGESGQLGHGGEALLRWCSTPPRSMRQGFGDHLVVTAAVRIWRSRV